MKRSLGSSDSMGALMSICPNTADDHHNQSPRNNNHYGNRDLQSMLDMGLDEEGCIEESGGHVSEKKRRLSVEQVKALEKNFEVENKLEPERKVKLAQELGLQPRQVAVWFQNRRARWKTKQLERDYAHLKADYEALKTSYDSLQHDNQTLINEIRELKSKLNEDNTESVKEEIEKQNNNVDVNGEDPSPEIGVEEADLDGFKSMNGGLDLEVGGCLIPDFNKDGSSDSDSSAILNDDNNNNNSCNYTNSPIIENLLMSSSSPPKSQQCFQFSTKPTYHHQFVKMEEHNFFGEETCNFFSEEQAPTLHNWYAADQWG